MARVLYNEMLMNSDCILNLFENKTELKIPSIKIIGNSSMLTRQCRKVGAVHCSGGQWSYIFSVVNVLS